LSCFFLWKRYSQHVGWCHVKIRAARPWRHKHYYRNADLSRLGNLCCPGFPTGNARSGQKGWPFVPGLATGTKSPLLSRLVTPTGTKGPFFSVPLFSIVFLFRLYFYISIKLMYWNSVCKISTNIYIYSYLYNICPR